MKLIQKTLVAAAAALLTALPALADVTVGISLPLTGPASGLGIPMQNYFKLWPSTIAGEKLTVIILDDATDPTKGVQNARKFVTEDKVDIIIGSAATPAAAPMAEVAAESGTVQLAASPVGLPPGKDAWTFRLPQSNDVMAFAVINLMKKQGVKSIGFLGYTDAYGELWLKAITAEADKGMSPDDGQSLRTAHRLANLSRLQAAKWGEGSNAGHFSDVSRRTPTPALPLSGGGS